MCRTQPSLPAPPQPLDWLGADDDLCALIAGDSVLFSNPILTHINAAMAGSPPQQRAEFVASLRFVSTPQNPYKLAAEDLQFLHLRVLMALSPDSPLANV